MRFAYKVETNHPTINEYNGEHTIKVYFDDYLKKYYAVGVWGCSKNYTNPLDAVMSLLIESGTTLISKELKDGAVS